jgi:hypothetical protein
MDRDELAGTLVVTAGVGIPLLGVLLGWGINALFAPAPLRLWREVRFSPRVAPEPEELLLFAFAASVPMVVAVLLVTAPVRGVRSGLGIPLSTVGRLGAVVCLALVVVGWLARTMPDELAYDLDPRYFDAAAMAVAMAVALAVVWMLTSRRGRRATVAAAEASPRLRSLAALGLGLLAVAATGLYALTAVYPAAGLGDAPGRTAAHLTFTLSDFAAFGNDATPLVDFTAQYANLLPWLAHPLLAASDYSPSSFTFVMAGLTVVTMLLAWRALALAVRSELWGAVLYLPVLALALRPMAEYGDERVSNASLTQIVPERYLMPFLLLWLCIRSIRGHRPQAPVAIFFVATLAVVNNPEFGGPALLAAFLTLLIGSAEPPRRRARVLVAHLAGGAVGAVALVALGTLLRAGALPRLDRLTYFSRFFAVQGFGLQPMRALGLHLTVFATFAAALILAAARKRAGDADRALTALLAFAGAFGLTASGYYVGRSNAFTMVALFPAWGLALAALAWTSVGWMRSTPRPRLLTPTGLLAVLAVAGLALAATELRSLPSPVTQAERVSGEAPPSPFLDVDEGTRFVSAETAPGEAVLILHPNGHLIARRASVHNTASIAHPFHVISLTQLAGLLEELREAGGETVFVGGIEGIGIYPSILYALAVRGWHATTVDEPSGLSVWRRGPPGAGERAVEDR